MTIQTMQIPPYGFVNIGGGETIAYCNGDAPHLMLRTGSDAVRLPLGHCVPADHLYAALVNPFPSTVVVAIGRGLPIRYGAEMSDYSASQEVVIKSESYRTYPAANMAAGERFAQGVLMKRGRAYVRIIDKQLSADSNVIIFRGASPEFLAAKPPSFMNFGVGLRKRTLEIDDSMYCLFGKYLATDIATWIAAAGYTGEVISGQHSNERVYMTTPEDAVFFCRYNNTGFDAIFQVEHLGAEVSEFD